MKYRQTKFSDVCGSMDELKRLLYEEKDKIFKNPKIHLEPLLEDALFMLSRMDSRLKEYKKSTEEICKYTKLMEEVGEANLEKAQKSAEVIQKQAKLIKDSEETEIKKLDEAAESIRSVASDLEGKLRVYKDLALGIYTLVIKIKGNRNWLLKDEDSKITSEKKYQAWLPPEPHKSKLLQRFAESTAYIIEPSQIGEEPLIQFEDGGLIPMSQVRWNPNLENFHPADFRPGSTGRKYRRK